MAVSKPFSPHTLTILCAYQCTAACRQCCFESSPKVKGRLTRKTIIARIEEARRAFPNLKLVVFSGGEALMLKDDLFASIAHCTSAGLLTRVVSNGYWGKTSRTARNTAKKLKEAGLCELNLSTGSDHQEWIPASSVIDAAIAVADTGILCLITVETEGKNIELINGILKNPLMAPYIDSESILVQSNSWMPFHDDAEDRHQKMDAARFREGCGQIFGTIVVTPHDNLSACCGLTLEHIPEMRLGKSSGSNMETLYASQLEDFMKIWIHVDGPYSIIERVMNEEAMQYLKNTIHICEACSILHKNKKIRDAIRQRYQEFIPEVTTRFKIAMAMRERAMKNQTCP